MSAKRPASAVPQSQFRCASDNSSVPTSLLAATLFAVRKKQDPHKSGGHVRPSTTTDKLRVKKTAARKRHRRPATVASIVRCEWVLRVADRQWRRALRYLDPDNTRPK